MSLRWKGGIVLAVVAALACGLVLGVSVSQPAQAAGDGKGAMTAGGPRYTVVHTEGTNLIVTDNKKNTLYFYTIDPEHEPGADLKLRGTVDLTQVGQKTIVPTLVSKKKKTKS
jgi:hypothetical protein